MTVMTSMVGDVIHATSHRPAAHRGTGIRRALAAGAIALALAAPLHAQGGRGGFPGQSQDTTGAGGAPALLPIIQAGRNASDLRVVVQRYNADRGALMRRYDIPLSPVMHARMRMFNEGWLARLQELDARRLNAAGRNDLDALRSRIRAEIDSIAAAERFFAQAAPLVPFARTLQQLQENRRDRLDIDPMQIAQTLSDVTKEVRRLTLDVRGAGAGAGPEAFRSITPDIAARTADFIITAGNRAPGAGGPGAGLGGGGGAGSSSLKSMLDNWYAYYHGYDPLFTWWARKPFEELAEALEAYAAAIRQEWRVTTD